MVDRVLEAAWRKAHAARVAVHWKRGDVARLGDVVGEGGFSLLFDQGCFHGLPDQAREGYVRGATSIAASGALFLFAAFVPAQRGPLPRVIGRDEIETRFAEWELVWARKEADIDIRLPPLVPDADMRWYLLRKH